MCSFQSKNMERKSKKELIGLIEEQSKSLTKYKNRLHDIVESYKYLVKEKEALEVSIKTLTDVGSCDETSLSTVEQNDDNVQPNSSSSDKLNEDSLQKLKLSLGSLTVEKARVENELRTDRKKLLLQIEELERNAVEKENTHGLERKKYENLIQDMKKKIGNQQREREREQQDHSLMLKELQNLLAVERASKEKLEDQVTEMQSRLNSKLSEKKVQDYENCISDLQNKLKLAQNSSWTAENSLKNHLIMMQKLQEEIEDMKTQYTTKMEEETKQADVAEEKLKLLTIVKEKRIANLESRISELSEMVGNYDKTKQQDLLTIQKLKEKLNQLQSEHSALNKAAAVDNKLWDSEQSNLNDQNKKLHMKNILTDENSENMMNIESDILPAENVHTHCQEEILQLKDELEFLKSKAENAMKEKYNKTSAALLSDAKFEREKKELKRKISQLQDQLQAAKSQMKLNEEYHNKITSNLEKSLDELKLLHKQEAAQMAVTHQTKLLELEHQIQKQRERTLSLLEEKDKEIGLLKSNFLSSIIKKEKSPNDQYLEDVQEIAGSDHEAAATLLSNSLISSQKDGHILHYVQELARKDVEISNLRQTRIQTESALRKLQQVSILMEETHTQEIESLRSKIKLLESSKDKDGTNVEYLKNVVLRFLKCSDPSSQKHMINAIATVLHFTNAEVQEVKSCLKVLR